ncbi:disintegrin and metalloproteinase domain-containing protein 10-like [Uloborus diversus]|uniref:disintegrin and metalloproteinase domain-containing protein 10-like n=1 Tax=Uloborus diversus TaxID=327109 RepID=UPI00240A72BC|nr:disintegrin and metalloproteinase domain-containing protein 10-like [Uloborus diversus]
MSRGVETGLAGYLEGLLQVSACNWLREGQDQVLNDYIPYFEPLFYDQYLFKEQHRRSIRSPVDRYFTLQFKAYNRMFRLRLKRDVWVFAEDTKFEDSKSSVHYDKARAVAGYVEGEENSSVHGILLDSGLFDGTVRVKDEEYYVEPAKNYFTSPRHFHSLIYRLSDIQFPETNRSCVYAVSKIRHHKRNKHRFHRKRSSQNKILLSDELYKIPVHKFHKKRLKWRKSIHRHSVDHGGDLFYGDFSQEHHVPERSLKSWFLRSSVYDSDISANNENITSSVSNHSSSSSASNLLPTSSKQQGNGGDVVPTVIGEASEEGMGPSLEDKSNVPYWRELDALHYTEDGRTGSSEPYGVRSIQRTQWTEDRGQRHVAVDRRKSTCLLYLQADHLFYQKMGNEEACIDAMTRHVQRVNSIYRTTDFDQDGRPDNISFLIKRIKVHTRPDDPDYRFVGNYGVEKFLELFSEDDYDAFCLAYMFTYRDFEGGTLGLAWTGDLKNAGGVCEKNGHYRGSLKSLNTGIITLLNYGKHVPPVVSHVTLAHEIGHNFGSPHDPEDDLHCTPGGDHGNYIMFARATSGDKKNNNKFSPCSLRSINAVLNTKARSVKGCFTEPLDAVCGNEVVEGAEECDCGWEEDCHEPCCFPMRVNPPQDQPPCRLRPAAFCSPSQGPCCSHDCRLKYGVLCREDNGCRTASYCDGKGPLCPPSTKKPNKTVCSEEFVCYNGECTGSICMAYGLESCQCIRSYHDPLIRSCELCCKIPGDELSCKSSFEWNLPPYDVPDLYAKPGAPCDNYNGYCDVHQSCREIDPSGPLATLRNLLMSPEGVAILKKWIAEKWWSMLLLFFGAAITVVLSVRLLTRRNAKNFLSTILPGQTDFRICNIRSSSRSHPSCLVTSPSQNSGPPLLNKKRVSRPRISTAPENGWV